MSTAGPRAETQPRSLSRPARSGATTIGGRMVRVLLVEDHETVREGLRLLVDGQPDMRVVYETGDGGDALVHVAAVNPDVIVLDLSMPGMSGLATAKALKVSSRAAVVVLTRHDDDAFVRELTAAGAVGYVLKQSPSSELVRAIRAVASGARYLDPALQPCEQIDDARSRVPALATARELDVLRLAASGHSNKEIADELDIKVKTVEVHKANAMRNLDLHGRSDLVRYAIAKGWLREQ